jgi:hypothetical protein
MLTTEDTEDADEITENQSGPAIISRSSQEPGLRRFSSCPQCPLWFVNCLYFAGSTSTAVP